MHQCRSIIWTAVLLCGLCWTNVVVAQEEPTTENSAKESVTEEKKPEPSAVPCFEAIEKKNSKQLEDEAFARLPQTAKAWLTEDVTYIIEAGERCAFLKLETDDEREQFVELFWLLRNSNPGSEENGCKEEHYRRVVFANEKFGAEIPGWKSDRGHAYILFGPPDTIDSHANGELTGPQPVGRPEPPQGSWEKWHYRYLEGFGNIDLEFVDSQESGDYRLAVPLQKKKSLGYRWLDSNDCEPARFTTPSGNESDFWIGPLHVPRVRFKDLEGMVAAQIIRDQVYFSHRAEYIKATHASTMTRIFIDIPGNEPSSRDDRGAEGFEVFGRISKLSGRVVDTFERDVSSAEWRRAGQVNPAWEVTVPLVPGPYRLAIVVKDLLSGKTGVMYTPLDVPTYEELDLANKPGMHFQQ
jgi:GWxTD domain-containing protein